MIVTPKAVWRASRLKLRIAHTVTAAAAMRMAAGHQQAASSTCVDAPRGVTATGIASPKGDNVPTVTNAVTADSTATSRRYSVCMRWMTIVASDFVYFRRIAIEYLVLDIFLCGNQCRLGELLIVA